MLKTLTLKNQNILEYHPIHSELSQPISVETSNFFPFNIPCRSYKSQYRQMKCMPLYIWNSPNFLITSDTLKGLIILYTLMLLWNLYAKIYIRNKIIGILPNWKRDSYYDNVSVRLIIAINFKSISFMYGGWREDLKFCGL